MSRLRSRLGRLESMHGRVRDLDAAIQAEIDARLSYEGSDPDLLESRRRVQRMLDLAAAGADPDVCLRALEEPQPCATCAFG